MTKTLKNPTAISNLFGTLGCCALIWTLMSASSAFGQGGDVDAPNCLPGGPTTINRCTAGGTPAQPPAEEVSGCTKSGDCFDCNLQVAYAGCESTVLTDSEGVGLCSTYCRTF